jgi:hypothetical protein
MSDPIKPKPGDKLQLSPDSPATITVTLVDAQGVVHFGNGWECHKSDLELIPGTLVWRYRKPPKP